MALDDAVVAHVSGHPGAGASAISAAVNAPVRALAEFLADNAVSGYPKQGAALDRLLDRSLQRLRRKGRLLYAAGTGWNIPR